MSRGSESKGVKKNQNRTLPYIVRVHKMDENVESVFLSLEVSMKI